MNARKPSRFSDSEFLSDHVSVLIKELIVILAISHVCDAVGVDVKRSERRRVDRKINRLVRQL